MKNFLRLLLVLAPLNLFGAAYPLLTGTNNFTGPNTVTNVANKFAGDGSGLTGINASSTNLPPGVLTNHQMGSVIMQGPLTTTNFISSGGGFLGDGLGVTGLSADHINTGTLLDGFLSANVPIQTNGILTLNSNLVVKGILSGDGSALTNLTATNITGAFNPSLGFNNYPFLPPMGINTFSVLTATETAITNSVNYMLTNGLFLAGYNQMWIDDGWQGGRDANGFIYADTNNFTTGMSNFVAYLHGRGFKVGIYTEPNTVTSAGKTGSAGHIVQDAQTFVNWRIDCVKYDLVNYPTNLNLFISALANSTNSHGPVFVRSGVGSGNPWQSFYTAANAWNWTGDWTESNPFPRYTNFLFKLDRASSHPESIHAGSLTDPDFMNVYSVGNPTYDPLFTSVEFGMYSLISGMLIIERANTFADPSISNDVVIITNSEVIAIDQDPGVIQAVPVLSSNVVQYTSSGGWQVWCKPLGSQYGSVKAVGFLNRSTNATYTISVNWTNIGLATGSLGLVRDVMSRTNCGGFTNSFTATVPAMSVGLYTITGQPTKDAGTLADSMLSRNVAILNRPTNSFTGVLSGNGAGLTNIPASAIVGNVSGGSSNIVDSAFTAVLNNLSVRTNMSGSGSGLTNLNASSLSTGTVPLAQSGQYYASNAVSGGQFPAGTVATNSLATNMVLMTDGFGNRVWSGNPQVTNLTVLGTAQVAGRLGLNAGEVSTNILVAATNSQVPSPTNWLVGSGYKTAATAGAQPVAFGAYVQPGQGSSNPTGNLIFGHDINDATLATLTPDLTISSGGCVGIGAAPSYLLDVETNASSGVLIVAQVKAGNGGLKLGSYGAGYGGFWGSGVTTPSVANYAMIASSDTTALNATSKVQFNILDSIKMILSGNGGLSLGSATDPGAGNMLIAGNINVRTNIAPVDPSGSFLTLGATATNSARRANVKAVIIFNDSATGTPQVTATIVDNGVTNVYPYTIVGGLVLSITNTLNLGIIGPSATIQMTDTSYGTGASVVIQSSTLKGM